MSKPKVGNLIYRQGDLFKSLPKNSSLKIIVPHITNVFSVMGSGFAAQVRELYPNTNKEYIEKCTAYGLSHPMSYRPVTFMTKEDFGYFANMTCQTGLSGSNNRNATYPDLVDCMSDVTDFCLEKKISDIFAPKFGSHLCGMNFDFIEELIKDIWLSAGLNVTVFTL